jgi:hypothetical protein
VDGDGLIGGGIIGGGAPFGDRDKAGRDRIEAGHEVGHLRAGAERDGLRRHQLVPLPARFLKRPVEVACHVVDRDIAAGWHGLSQRGHHRGRLSAVLDVGKGEQQQDGDRLAEVQGCLRAAQDRVRIAGVGVDKADGPARRGRH